MNRHTITLAGNGSYSNRGCEAILRGTTAILREKIGNCQFISNYFPTPEAKDHEFETDADVIHRPFPILKRKSLPWLEEQITRKFFHQPYNIRRVANIIRRSLNESEAILLLGGDNFSLDYPNTDTHFALARMGVAANKPTIIWGASVGPFSRDPGYERWAAEELKRVTLICSRETSTLKYLASIGVKDNVLLTADPSFFLKPSECAIPEEIEAILQKGCIGVNLSPLLHNYVKITGPEPGLTAWARIAAEIVRHLLRRFSMPILLIPHVTSEIGYIGRDDYLFMKQVALLLNEPEGVFVLGPNYTAGELKWIISRTCAFAGARTHSTLAAISTGVPTICIGYSLKAQGICQDIYGHRDWLITGQDLVKNPANLSDLYSSLIENQTIVRSHLSGILPEMVQRSTRAAEAVKSLLSK